MSDEAGPLAVPIYVRHYRKLKGMTQERLADAAGLSTTSVHNLEAGKGRGRFVKVPAMVFLKSALHMTLKEKGWSRADLMRALQCQREHVDRLFRLDHNSRLDSLEEAFKALGVPLRFDMPFPQADAA